MTQDATSGEVFVKMAEIGVGYRHGTLKTLLGSCIGILLYERSMRIAGLAHVVMPDSAGREVAIGKYADTAIPETVRRMELLAYGKRLSLVAKIAGGANMFQQVTAYAFNSIGQQNLEAVEKCLSELKIPILARHVGGNVGRKLIADIGSGNVQIQMVGKSIVQI
jgi:chemotaxis protein CheD